MSLRHRLPETLCFVIQTAMSARRDVASFFFFQAEDGIRDGTVTGVQTCALPISLLGQRAARSLLFSGELITAGEALAIGAVDAISARDETLRDALAKCRELCTKEIGRASCRERAYMALGDVTL